MVDGRHHGQNLVWIWRGLLGRRLIGTDDLLGFEASAMMASAVKVRSRKKEKVNGPSESEEILLGCYIKLRSGSQESCVYLGINQLRCGKPMFQNFGIKSFYPKIGGHVFTPKFGRRARELAGFQDCANQGVDCIRVDISRFGCDTGIGSLWMTSANNDDEIWLASRRYISNSTKGERLESKLS